MYHQSRQRILYLTAKAGLQCIVSIWHWSGKISTFKLCFRSIVAFLLTEGAWDNAQGWASLTAAERNTTKAAYNDAGIALMVSAFGSTDTPTSSGADPNSTASTMAAWVIQYGLDGIDVDYEVSSKRNPSNEQPS